MSAVVKVPVLPQQTSLTLPIFSGASSFLIRILSANIFDAEKAKETPTVRGRPSGMATTINTNTNATRPASLDIITLAASPAIP